MPRLTARVDATIQVGEGRLIVRQLSEEETTDLIIAEYLARANWDDAQEELNEVTVRVRFRKDDPNWDEKYLAYVSSRKREWTKYGNDPNPTDGIPKWVPFKAWGKTRKDAIHNLARAYGIEPRIITLMQSHLMGSVYDPEPIPERPTLTAEQQERIWAIIREGSRSDRQPRLTDGSVRLPQPGVDK